MAMTAYGHGTEAVWGFKTHTGNWNTVDTGTALSTGDGFPVLLAGVPKTTTEIAANNSAPGTLAIQKPGVKTREGVAGSFKSLAQFNCDALLRMFACHYGAEATAQQGGTTAYNHAFTYATNTALVGNLAGTDNIRLRDFPMTKIMAFEIEIMEGEIGVVTFEPALKKELNDDSGSNTLANVNTNCTIPSVISTPYLTLADTTVRVNAQSGGALGGGDVVGVTGVRMRFARAWNVGRRNSVSGLFIREPVGGAWGLVGLELTFDADEDTGYTWMKGATALKADVTIDSGVEAGTAYNYQWLAEYPYLEPSTDGLPDLSTEDITTEALNMVGKKALTNPTGMAFQQAQLTVTDQVTGDHSTSS